MKERARLVGCKSYDGDTRAHSVRSTDTVREKLDVVRRIRTRSAQDTLDRERLSNGVRSIDVLRDKGVAVRGNLKEESIDGGLVDDIGRHLHLGDVKCQSLGADRDGEFLATASRASGPDGIVGMVVTSSI